MPEWLGILIAFIYGTVVGSFLNVCIWRLPRDESIIRPGSHCPSCSTLLKPWDNIPLFSFLILRCRCRYCGAKISWRYFGVELLTGIYFVLVLHSFGWTINALAYALFGASLIATFFIDLEHWIIPDQLSLFGIGLGVAHDAAELVAGSRSFMWIPVPWTDGKLPLPQSIAGILACGGVFLAIAIISYYIFKKEGVGGGDIKLAAAIGANIAIGQAMLSFFLAVALGSIIGVGLILARRKTRKDYVPFGPMMVAGALVTIFYGRQIVEIWRSYVIFVGS